MDFKEKTNVPNPREKTNPISKLFFWWILPLFRKGSKQDLVLDDIYNVLIEDASSKLGDRLTIAWEKQLSNAKLKGKKPKFFRAILSVFGGRYFSAAIFIAIDELGIRIAQALFLKWLIESFSVEKQDEEDHELKQYLWAGGVCLTTLLHTLVLHPTMFGLQHIGMKARIAASSMIYRKALKLSKATQGQTTVGQLVNLLSNDVNRFDTSVFFLHYFYIGPIQFGIFTYLLWRELGVSCMAGAGFILILMPVQYFIGKMFSTYRFKIAQKTDERGRLMNEIIIAMRVIKMYAWEKPFSQMIDHVRRLEVRVLRKAAFLRSFYLSLFISSSKVITFLTFITYVLIDDSHVLTADKVFFAVSIYNVMRQIMISFVPTAAAAIGELIVSTNRIETFLLLDEQTVSPNVTFLLENGVPENGDDFESKRKSQRPTLKMSKACASWTKDRVTLDKVDIDVSGDKLVIVCGPVGSGKTSLLHALLAELPITSGKCLVQGKTTYACQEPWIFSGNLRQNILFGHDYDEDRYNDVITVCALEDDLKQLPYGDNTVVGERGVALSGGQKARLNLARALYKPASVYLLDDPLSAVDARVSRHIFDKCIKKYLKGYLRILVTHQLQYLPQADHIVVFTDGKVIAQGTYHELVESGIDFVSLMASETDEDGNRKESIIKPPGVEKPVLVIEEKVDQGKPDAQVEKMAEGSVDFKLYWEYFKSGDSVCGMMWLVFGFLLSQLLYSVSEYWLSTWTNEEDKKAKRELAAAQPNATTLNPPTDDDSYLGQDVYIYVYSGLTFLIFFVTKVRAVYFFHYCMRISINVHNRMFGSLVRAPTKFFDDNPSGRIMNRFTKDLGSMDELLPPAFFDALSIFLLSIGVIAIVVVSNYLLIVPTVLLVLALWLMRRFYIRTARDVKRIESVARSPLFTHLAASLQGLTTIRSSNSQSILIHQFDGHQDLHSAAWYIFIAANRWFGIWLEMISVVFLTAVTFSFLLIISDALGGNVGLAISSALTLTGTFQWGMRQSAETENLMTSVERALEYSKVASEAPLDSQPDKKPPKGWPSGGKVEFRHLYLAYEEQDVLKDLSFEVKEREKIGIVGRTGAGKSSIIAALFRMTEPRGDILIDGIRINDIGLHDLRRNISIIPQDPVLFSGTIRYNLDPFDQFEDKHLWEVLEEVDLKNGIESLDYKVSDGGSNFSVGQRQLVCLARAILRHSKILILDEATANVDIATDNFIQRTIRSKFSDCTIITIAHRLHSVMDCDRILVLDHGFLKEYDHPHNLLQNPNGILTNMIGHTGNASSSILRQIAAETFTGRRGSFRADNVSLLKKAEAEEPQSPTT